MAMKRLVIFGHRGALGQSLVKAFTNDGWTGYGVDPRAIAGSTGPTGETIFAEVSDPAQIPSNVPIHAVVCVAGAFEMNAEDLFKQLSRLWAANVEPSLVAADFFSKRGASYLILTGSQSVRDGTTPWAKAYGMCKSAVHHLAESVAAEKSDVPNRKVVCLLPSMLDTPANRKSMPDADFSKWTPTDTVAKLVLDLSNGGSPKGYSQDSVYFPV